MCISSAISFQVLTACAFDERFWFSVQLLSFIYVVQSSHTLHSVPVLLVSSVSFHSLQALICAPCYFTGGGLAHTSRHNRNTSSPIPPSQANKPAIGRGVLLHTTTTTPISPSHPPPYAPWSSTANAQTPLPASPHTHFSLSRDPPPDLSPTFGHGPLFSPEPIQEARNPCSWKQQTASQCPHNSVFGRYNPRSRKKGRRNIVEGNPGGESSISSGSYCTGHATRRT